MKNYTITVNGNVYDVTVEEGVATGAPVATAPRVVQQKSAPVAVASVGGAGSVKIEAGAAGKVFKLEASIGQVVKKDETIVVLEAMKMEIPVVAPQDGKIVSIDVAVGDPVEAGALLATLN